MKHTYLVKTSQGVATPPSTNSNNGCLGHLKAVANEELECKDLPIRLGSATETLLAGVLSGVWFKVRPRNTVLGTCRESVQVQ